MITLNTYVGEWRDTDERTRTIANSALGDVPHMCPAETGTGDLPGRSVAGALFHL
jgi:hypothetical protein